MTNKGDQVPEEDTVARGVSNDTSIARDRQALLRNLELVSQVKQVWRHDLQKANANAFLDHHPEIQRNRSLVIDLAFEEYCLRRESGMDVDPESFCRRFPNVYGSLYKQIEVDEYMRDNSLFVSGVDELEKLEAGDFLFDYTVVERLGSGAFANVYICSDPKAGERQVVVKQANHGAFEAMTMGRLRHPNIMPVYAVGENDATGASGIAMPFYGRSTLADLLMLAFQEGIPTKSQAILDAASNWANDSDLYQIATPPIQIDRRWSYVDGIVAIGAQIASGLHHANDEGIVHGDLKPSNIILTNDGAPMICDFNLSQDNQSRSLLVGGTLPYMAPEQIRSTLLEGERLDRPSSERCDVFSLGAILYELLTGQLPFGRPDRNDQKKMTLDFLSSQENPPRPIREFNRSVDKKLATLIESCLSLEPAVRPNGMQTLSQQLSRKLTHVQRFERKLRTDRRTLLLTIGSAVIPTTALGVFLSYQLEPEFDKALRLARRGHTDAASRVLEKILARQPDHTEARKRLAELRYASAKMLQNEGELSKAIESLDDAILKDPRNDKARELRRQLRIALAKELARNQRLSEADDMLTRVLEERVSNDVRFLRGQILVLKIEKDAGSSNDSRVHGDLAVYRNDPHKRAEFLEWSVICTLLRNRSRQDDRVWELNANDLEASIAEGSATWRTHNNLGKVYQHRSTIAKNEAAKAIRDRDREAMARFREKGNEHYLRYLDELKTAIKLEPKNWEANINLAYHATGPKIPGLDQVAVLDEAFQASLRALEIRPNSALASMLAAAIAVKKLARTNGGAFREQTIDLIIRSNALGSDILKQLSSESILTDPRLQQLQPTARSSELDTFHGVAIPEIH